MPRLRLRRSLAIPILALALVPLPTGFWGWLTAVWAEAGCILDPGGQCVPEPSPDEGCIIDPGGGVCAGRQ